MKSQISTKDLRYLRSKLPHGSIKKIAEDLSLDQSTISKVLSGDFFNEAVIDAAIKIVEERNSAIENWKNRMSNL